MKSVLAVENICASKNEFNVLFTSQVEFLLQLLVLVFFLVILKKRFSQKVNVRCIFEKMFSVVVVGCISCDQQTIQPTKIKKKLSILSLSSSLSNVQSHLLDILAHNHANAHHTIFDHFKVEIMCIKCLMAFQNELIESRPKVMCIGRKLLFKHCCEKRVDR